MTGAFQYGAFQANAFLVEVPNGTAGGRGYGRIAYSGPNYYPFGKKEAQKLARYEKKKKKLDEEIRELQARLERARDAAQEYEFLQGLKQQLLLLYERIASLEADIAWLRELQRIAEEQEMMEVFEVYLIARMH